MLFWTIKKLAEGKIDEVDFPPEYPSAAGEVARLLQAKKVPKISETAAQRVAIGLGPGKTVVTMLYDTGERYLSMEKYFNI